MASSSSTGASRTLFNSETFTQLSDHSTLSNGQQDPIQPSKLIGLPLELWTITLGYLGKQDLMAVRQTHNRRLCDLAKSSFAKVLPSTWRFVFTSESLEALQRLTADRVYAIRCKALSFGTDRLVPSVPVPSFPLPPAMARTSEPRGTKTSRSRLVVAAEMHTASVQRHKERQADANQHKELHARQNRFIKAGGHTALIIKSLLNLKAVGNTETTLGVYDDDIFCLVTDARYAGFASRDAYVTPGGKALAKDGAAFDTLGSLSNAICCSEYPVKRLEFELSGKLRSFDGRSWRKLDPLPEIRMQIARFSKPSTLNDSVLNSSLTIVHNVLWDETFKRSGILYCPFVDRLYGNASDGAFVTSFRTVKLRSGFGFYEAIEKLLNLVSSSFWRLMVSPSARRATLEEPCRRTPQ